MKLPWWRRDSNRKAERLRERAAIDEMNRLRMIRNDLQAEVAAYNRRVLRSRAVVIRLR